MITKSLLNAVSTIVNKDSKNLTEAVTDKKLQSCIRELALTLKKYKASLYYTTDDDGVYLSINGSSEEANLGFIDRGTSKEIEDILAKD